MTHQPLLQGMSSFRTITIAFVLSISNQIYAESSHVYGEAMIAGGINPLGFYYHEFSGAIAGSEFSRYIERPGNNRFNFNDLTADGAYDGSVMDSGAITLDSGLGIGQFSDANNFELDFTLGGGFNIHSVVNRVPYTTDQFPVTLNSPESGPSNLAGVWDCTTEQINPETGAILSMLQELLMVTVDGDQFRFERENGDYFQGVFETQDLVAFRVIEPAPSAVEFRTFPGSELSLNRNLIGEVRIADVTHLSAIMCLQTRFPFPNQAQTMFRFRASRSPTTVPAASTWGLIVMALLVGVAGTLAIMQSGQLWHGYQPRDS